MKTYNQHPSLSEALEFDIKLTEEIFGVKFKGTTWEDKVAFANKYENERKKVVQAKLSHMYEQYKEDLKTKGQI